MLLYGDGSPKSSPLGPSKSTIPTALQVMVVVVVVCTIVVALQMVDTTTVTFPSRFDYVSATFRKGEWTSTSAPRSARVHTKEQPVGALHERKSSSRI